MINAFATAKIEAHVADALAKGARRVTAPRKLDGQSDPVVLDGAATEMQRTVRVPRQRPGRR